jgi:LEA14-like dessication related protein
LPFLEGKARLHTSREPMTQFLNTVLVTILAFFGALAAFSFFAGDSPGGGGGSVDQAQALLVVTEAEPAWVRPADVDEAQAEAEEGEEGEAALGQVGPSIRMEYRVRNPAATPATVKSASYEAFLNGERVADGSDGKDFLVGGSAVETSSFTLALPASFAATWWDAYVDEGESATLRIAATLDVERAGQEGQVPFEWQASWDGDLLGSLERAGANCEDAQEGLCLEALEPAWTEDGVSLGLKLRNAGTDEATVRNTSTQLALGGIDVAIAGSTERVVIAPEGDGTVTVEAAITDAALATWWSGHTARCETSSVSLEVQLTVALEHPEEEGGGVDVVLIQWSFPAADFASGFLCHHAP